MIEQRVLEAYRDGSPIRLIQESFSLTEKQVKEILINYRDKNRSKRTFVDEFKKIIAERDINGIPRRQISIELEININTVKKACEKFGQALKDKASSDNLYSRIDGIFSKSECPLCKSKKVNEIEEDTTYCKNCGNEYIYFDDHVLKVNWEYMEE